MGTIIGLVIVENIRGNTLLQVGEKLYIAPYVGIPKNHEMAVPENMAIAVPSLLIALDVMTQKDVKSELKKLAEFFVRAYK